MYRDRFADAVHGASRECTQEGQKQTALNVFAAISLTDALGEIGTAFTAENGVKIYYNFAASTTLQRQLEKGATADIFISASPRQVVALETRGLLEAESRQGFANQSVGARL